tara:strand:+ start:401 stop:718 length:318 start_codon:yes stop_codon:yes gene_type:complete
MEARMVNIVTVVKYKVKDGYEDAFVAAINDYDYSNSNFMRLIALDDNQYVSIMEYDDIEKTGQDEVTGLSWLDQVEHMLEFFGESRTDAYSGIVMSEFSNADIFK